jgi:hypothetical protein
MSNRCAKMRLHDGGGAQKIPEALSEICVKARIN